MEISEGNGLNGGRKPLMQYLALAMDYDGTLAEDGHVNDEAVAAVTRLRATGRRLILVTGRELPELGSVFSQLTLFDCVVAENGGLLFWPEDCREEVLGEPIPPTFVSEMNRLEVKPYSVGRSIFATWRPHEVTVQEAIQRLKIDYHVIFNKRAVMVLPNKINKGSGLTAALTRLKIPPSKVVGIGDAENDFSFLRMCGFSAAVANALPAVQSECDITMRGDHGRGVCELIDRLVDDEAGLRPRHAADGHRQPIKF